MSMIKRGVEAEEPSRVKQEFGARSDINFILRRYRKSGMVESVNRARPAFADLVGVKDLHSTLTRVRKAEEAFEALPSELRSRFHNSSQELLSFISDRRNFDEAVKLGLVEPRKAPVEPAPARVVVVEDTRPPKKPKE